MDPSTPQEGPEAIHPGVFPRAHDTLVVRPVRRGDLDQVIAIDATVTGLEKRKYWASVYRRYGAGERNERQFLVALAHGRVVGFVIGEVRDWEFGSPPCGWVFAIDVDPQARLGGVGTRLLEAISASFRSAGVRKLRTMLARDNTLILSFFRSQGLMAGPLISLEMDLDA
jgi:ribosomal protein S18 acetylase RimI-like enzyme